MEIAVEHESVSTENENTNKRREIDPKNRDKAVRTAFVARFIVLREARRSRAHRVIENLIWDEDTTAEELAKLFRNAFLENGDRIGPIERDIKRALEHAKSSAEYFLDQYLNRNFLSFLEALADYERSNRLLFGDDLEGAPRSGGWKTVLPSNRP